MKKTAIIAKSLPSSRSNTDAFGTTWRLKAGGYKQIERSNTELWRLSSEVESYGLLLRNLMEEEIPSGGLYGLGLALERICRRLNRIHERLSNAVTSEIE